VVGKISGVYNKTMEKAAVIPNFPIMMNVFLTATSDTLFPVPNNQTFAYCESHKMSINIKLQF